MEPQPIETAPRDGSVILTECGFVRFLDQRRWGSAVPHGKWACCEPGGELFTCADEGESLCDPKRWTPVPEWIR